MLDKQPKSRPSLKQVVSTDFLKSHISKLLSHTLRNKNGGALVDATENIAGGGGRGGNGGDDKTEKTAAVAAIRRKELTRLLMKLQLYAAQRDREREMKEEHLVSTAGTS